MRFLLLLVNSCYGGLSSRCTSSCFTAAYPADELSSLVIALALLGSGSSVDCSGTFVVDGTLCSASVAPMLPVQCDLLSLVVSD